MEVQIVAVLNESEAEIPVADQIRKQGTSRVGNAIQLTLRGPRRAANLALAPSPASTAHRGPAGVFGC